MAMNKRDAAGTEADAGEPGCPRRFRQPITSVKNA